MALQWYRVAADEGHVMAQYNLGAAYDARASESFHGSTVASKGHAQAQFHLGVSYCNDARSRLWEWVLMRHAPSTRIAAIAAAVCYVNTATDEPFTKTDEVVYQ